MKKGMLDAYKSGIFKKTGYPHISVHDEICLSYHPDLRVEFEELRTIMETAIRLKVPVRMGLEVGPNWGSVGQL
jgi:DNA polymerase I-like protein with 3'-5' exonuclease and polymerase domains